MFDPILALLAMSLGFLLGGFSAVFMGAFWVMTLSKVETVYRSFEHAIQGLMLVFGIIFKGRSSFKRLLEIKADECHALMILPFPSDKHELLRINSQALMLQDKPAIEELLTSLQAGIRPWDSFYLVADLSSGRQLGWSYKHGRIDSI